MRQKVKISVYEKWMRILSIEEIAKGDRTPMSYITNKDMKFKLTLILEYIILNYTLYFRHMSFQ